MPQESGIPRWMPSFSRKISKGVNQIQMCIYSSLMVIRLLLFLYVDDLLITGSTVTSISVIKTALHNAFEMSDLVLLKQFLGLEIEQNFDGIMVTQYKYISDLLVNFNMDECKAAPFHFLPRISLEEGKSTTPMDCTIYRQLIGSLLNLTHSRPDFCYAMNVV